MAAKPVAYRYVATFPRDVDTPRPAWPLDLIDRALALADVVDATFPELTAAWTGDEPMPHHTSYRRRVELVTVSATPAVASVAEGRVRAFLEELKVGSGADRVVVTRGLVDVVVL